jgi:hypothetical protein
MKTRKELPRIGFLKHRTLDVNSVVEYLEAQGLLNYQAYNDIKASHRSKYKDFVVLNSFCKNSFFKESAAADLEGEEYVQLYLTDFDESKRANDFPVENIYTTVFSRQKRLNADSANYVPEADELNYGVRNNLVAGVLSEILDGFQDRVTRVRLACLKAHSEIRAHVDYDPSYICRFHIPLITNSNVKMYLERHKEIAEYHMPSDGRIYFFNSGLKHWVRNLSDHDRLHLIVDVHGQTDLENIETLVF